MPTTLSKSLQDARFRPPPTRSGSTGEPVVRRAPTRNRISFVAA
jgi:hypothetical protein